MKQILVVGGGAAGMMAAISAAEHGGKVTLLEKMPSVGRKLLITGKGRCNITNNCDLDGLIQNMPGNGNFLYSAFSQFTNHDVRDFFHKHGLLTKVERGGRVFPISDKASDVVATLRLVLRKLQVNIVTEHPVKEFTVSGGKISKVTTTANQDYDADAFILATGGASYPGTGSSGDGYRLAAALGHTIIPLRPSLVPLESEEEWVKELQGLSLKNIRATIFADGKPVASEFGEMLFTHFGVSGPVILSLSEHVSEFLAAQKGKKRDVTVEINLKPALTAEVLDQRIQRDFEKFIRKRIKNALNDLLPVKLIDVMIDLAHIDPEKPVHQVKKNERLRLAYQLQHICLTIRGARPLSEAVVTAGGVSTKEINSKTMNSKLISNLYFAGEIIDVNGYTGGYNLQAAFPPDNTAGFHSIE